MSSIETIGQAIGYGELSALTTSATAPCVVCSEPVETTEAFAGSIHCDPCFKKVCEERRLDEIKEWWYRWCPKQYLKTDVQHETFARAWKILKGVKNHRQNIILCGASGQCKTRVALQRMKVLLARHGLEPHALWADTLDEKLEGSKYRNDWKKAYQEAPVLLIDDLFTAGASLERYTKYIKGLLDFRLREEKITIITTNLKARDLQQESAKFQNETKADQQRIEAIIRRIDGEFQCVDVDAGVGDGRF